MICLWPIYATGEPEMNETGKDESKMDILTILNVSGNEGRIVFIYFLSLFAVPLAALYVLLTYN